MQKRYEKLLDEIEEISIQSLTFALCSTGALIGEVKA